MRQIQGLLLILICTTATAAVKGGEPTIKMLGVGSPIVGGQSTFGRVVLTAPAAQRVVITLGSSNPNIATTATNVIIIGAGKTDQTFVVKTDPVAAPTTLTFTARTAGSPDATATFTVMPPALAILDCEAKSVPGGTRATCKAWMDGLVAVGGTPQIALSTSDARVASPAQPSVTVRAGSRSVTFDVIAADLPQSAMATISASYAGVTKSSSLTVTPAAISSFGCAVVEPPPQNVSGSSTCSVIGGDFSPSGHHRYVGFAVRITAPAPPSGFKIPLNLTLGAPPNANGQEPPSNPLDTGLKTFEVPAGKEWAFYPFYTSPAASTYIIKASAKDPITLNSYETELTVVPTGIRVVEILPATISAVPLGGTELKVRVEFQTLPPKNGIAYDVTYSGTTDITGPARVRIDPLDSQTFGWFRVNVFPCALNPPCHVSVTLGGKTGTATVNP